MWTFGLKGYQYYLGNPWFWAKMGSFVAIGLLSIPPTLRFIAWSRASKVDPAFVPPDGEVRSTLAFLRGQSAFFVLVLIFAATMAVVIPSTPTNHSQPFTESRIEIFCPTSKMSHAGRTTENGGAEKPYAKSQAKSPRWLWRLVGKVWSEGRSEVHRRTEVRGSERRVPKE